MRRWVKRFREGDKTLEDLPHERRPLAVDFVTDVFHVANLQEFYRFI